VVVHPSGPGPGHSTRDLSGSTLTAVIPDTSYAKTADGANVAYQVIGDGPVDIVYSAGWFSNVDLIWEQRSYRG
jgi:hypothetical protein